MFASTRKRTRSVRSLSSQSRSRKRAKIIAEDRRHQESTERKAAHRARESAERKAIVASYERKEVEQAEREKLKKMETEMSSAERRKMAVLHASLQDVNIPQVIRQIIQQYSYGDRLPTTKETYATLLKEFVSRPEETSNIWAATVKTPFRIYMIQEGRQVEIAKDAILYIQKTMQGVLIVILRPGLRVRSRSRSVYAVRIGIREMRYTVEEWLPNLGPFTKTPFLHFHTIINEMSS